MAEYLMLKEKIFNLVAKPDPNVEKEGYRPRSIFLKTQKIN